MNEPMRLLTDDELWEVTDASFVFRDSLRRVVKAQLTLDQQHEQERVKRIFRAISGDIYGYLVSRNPPIDEPDFLSLQVTKQFLSKRLEALKKQEGMVE